MQHTQEHSHPSPNYLGVFIALAVLTVMELGVTARAVHDIVPAMVDFQIPLLILLALAKAALIVLFYMHLKYDSKLFSATFLLGIFLGLIFTVVVFVR